MDDLDNIEKLERLTSSGEQRVIIIREIEKPPVVKEVKVKVKEEPSNGKGTAGFVLAIISLCLGWVPVAGWAVWILGFVFSMIGIFHVPRGLAIAGLFISIVALFVIGVIYSSFWEGSFPFSA